MTRSNRMRDRGRPGAHRTRVSFVAPLSLLALALLAGCALPWQQQQSARALRAQPVMHLALLGMGSSDALSVDPAEEAPVGLDTPGSEVTSLIFDQLVTLDDQLRPELWGAESVTISPDGLA